MEFKLLKSTVFSIALVLGAQGLATVSPETVREKVGEHLTEIRSCYENELPRQPGLHGKVVVDWDIDDKGNVTKISINSKKTTLKDESVRTCIVEKFKTWKFPPASKGQTLSVSYPFVFSKR